MKKILLLLLSTFLIASCNKKDTASTPPAEGAKPAAANAGGHPSGGAITQISPPGVTGGQAGFIEVAIAPTGHSDPANDGNPTIVLFETKLSNVVMTVKNTINSDTLALPIFQNQINSYTLQPMTDTTQTNVYMLLFRRNGVPLAGVVSGPLNAAGNNGFQVTNYYFGPIGQMANNAVWVMVMDRSLMK